MCTCSPQWRALNWTSNGPTPHDNGCPDGQYAGYDYIGLLDLARESENRQAQLVASLAAVEIALSRMRFSDARYGDMLDLFEKVECLRVLVEAKKGF